MSSTALPTSDADYQQGFDPAVSGLQAHCDGGGYPPGSKRAGRQEFTGTLTGVYRDFGPYPWRWYLLTLLTRKPEGYPHEAVWCEADSLTLLDTAVTKNGAME